LDYLQYYARFAAGKTSMDQVGATLVELGRVARETNAALMVIGSQGRETNKSGGASMYGGRSSGEIEYDADYLFSLTKDKDSATVSMPGATEFRTLSAVKTGSVVPENPQHSTSTRIAPGFGLRLIRGCGLMAPGGVLPGDAERVDTLSLSDCHGYDSRPSRSGGYFRSGVYCMAETASKA
jgi:hypothetical protein